VQELIANENRPKSTRITRVIQGFETHSFKSNFEVWPASSGTGTTGGEEGRGKVAGTFCLSHKYDQFCSCCQLE